MSRVLFLPWRLASILVCPVTLATFDTTINHTERNSIIKNLVATTFLINTKSKTNTVCPSSSLEYQAFSPKQVDEILFDSLVTSF